MTRMPGCIWASQVVRRTGRNVKENWHMQRESTWKHMSRVLGKTTVIVRTTNLLNLSKPKEKKKKEGKEGKRRKR